MTTKTRIFILLIFLPIAVNAQWNYLNGFVTAGVNMEVVNQDTLIYSNSDASKIYHSFDGGETFTEFQTILEGSWISDFDFPSDNIGYGCGGTNFGIYRDVIIKTEDAGMTWDTLTTNSFWGYEFNNIEFLNVDTGFVASGHRLYRTADGGENFIELNIISEGVLRIRDLTFTPEGVLFASTSKLTSPNAYHISLYRSDDLGETWLEVYSDDMDEVNNFNNRFIGSIQFLSANVGYASGGNGVFLKTADAGLNWTQSFVSPLTQLTALYFTSEEVGYINNAGGIYKTTDGGETWAAQNMNLPSIVKDIQFANSEVGYAASYEHIYKTTNGGEILSVSKAELSLNIKIFPNPSSNELKIQFDEDIAIHQLELMDTNGKVVKSFPNKLTRLDLSGLASGVYILKILTDQRVVSKRVVVE